jgi:hypothetical protein
VSRQWFDVFITLPGSASVEIDLDPETSTLRAQVECHSDPTTLLQLSDALRAAVVEIDTARDEIASREVTS